MASDCQPAPALPATLPAGQPLLLCPAPWPVPRPATHTLRPGLNPTHMFCHFLAVPQHLLRPCSPPGVPQRRWAGDLQSHCSRSAALYIFWATCLPDTQVFLVFPATALFPDYPDFQTFRSSFLLVSCSFYYFAFSLVNTCPVSQSRSVSRPAQSRNRDQTSIAGCATHSPIVSSPFAPTPAQSFIFCPNIALREGSRTAGAPELSSDSSIIPAARFPESAPSNLCLTAVPALQ